MTDPLTFMSIGEDVFHDLSYWLCFSNEASSTMRLIRWKMLGTLCRFLRRKMFILSIVKAITLSLRSVINKQLPHQIFSQHRDAFLVTGVLFISQIWNSMWIHIEMWYNRMWYEPIVYSTVWHELKKRVSGCSVLLRDLGTKAAMIEKGCEWATSSRCRKHKDNWGQMALLCGCASPV